MCFFILAGSFVVPAVGVTPSSEAHLVLFGGREKSIEQEFRRPNQNHLTALIPKLTVETMKMFSSLNEFWTFSGLKSGGAS